eukprot:754936-Hanusia_phi.AAC.6
MRRGSIQRRPWRVDLKSNDQPLLPLQIMRHPPRRDSPGRDSEPEHSGTVGPGSIRVREPTGSSVPPGWQCHAGPVYSCSNGGCPDVTPLSIPHCDSGLRKFPRIRMSSFGSSEYTSLRRRVESDSGRAFVLLS